MTLPQAPDFGLGHGPQMSDERAVPPVSGKCWGSLFWGNTHCLTIRNHSFVSANCPIKTLTNSKRNLSPCSGSYSPANKLTYNPQPKDLVGAIGGISFLGTPLFTRRSARSATSLPRSRQPRGAGAGLAAESFLRRSWLWLREPKNNFPKVDKNKLKRNRHIQEAAASFSETACCF